jgi:hypothetical protein
MGPHTIFCVPQNSIEIDVNSVTILFLSDKSSLLVDNTNASSASKPPINQCSFNKGFSVLNN